MSPVLKKVVLLSSVDEVASLLDLRRLFEGWLSTFSYSITCEEFVVTGSEVTNSTPLFEHLLHFWPPEYFDECHLLLL